MLTERFDNNNMWLDLYKKEVASKGKVAHVEFYSMLNELKIRNENTRTSKRCNSKNLLNLIDIKSIPYHFFSYVSDYKIQLFLYFYHLLLHLNTLHLPKTCSIQNHIQSIENLDLLKRLYL